ncbi:MAG: D-lactate dehydrogenase (Cytochrome) [Clostridia bacterium 62_21]|nr:MAG: D-lactate dehydrogenase (Cytochrome) [Clostridia bacterium 62_21]
MGNKRRLEQLQRRLQQIVGHDFVFSCPEDTIPYSFDATYAEGRPEIVVLPGTAAEVAAVLAAAYEEEVPLTPRGAGTGLSGGALAVGGVLLVLTRMHRILELNKQSLYAVVEPGVVTAELQRAAARKRLFYPPDPSSAEVCTIGGNIAENAGGAHGFKYGVTRDYLLGLEFALPSGELITTGGYTVKNVTGYDLSRLLCGSEGTLGVITKAVLRLIPAPEARRTILAVFAAFEAAAEAVSRIIDAGVVPAAFEIMDRAAVRCVERYLRLGLPANTAAFIVAETDGYEDTAARLAREVAALCRKAGAQEVRVAQTSAEAEAFWRARRSVSAALARLKPFKVGEDIAVPLGRMPELVNRLQAIREQENIDMVVFGHAADGNLHPNIIANPRDGEEMKRVRRAMVRIFDAALELGGTLSGEHGIGTLKAPYLHRALSPAAADLMQRIKAVFDPKGLLNPGKIWADRDET